MTDRVSCESCSEDRHTGCNGRTVDGDFCACPLLRQHGVYPPAAVVDDLR